MGCFKHCLMGHTSRSMEDSGTDNDLKCRKLAQVSEKNFSMLCRNCSCDILVKEVAACYPCPKSLLEAEVKRFGLIPLAEEIPKYSNIDSVM